MNKDLIKKLETLPRAPGVYFHKSANGEVIYVGKAAVLKNRVKQYFQASRNLDAKTMALVAEIADTDWVETESEIDALFLESEMVKRYMPRYNVLLRDDKSQSFVRIDMKSNWPYVSLTRNPIDDGAEYYGPFYNSYALRKALRYLRRVFPYHVKPHEKVTSRLDEDLGLSPRHEDGQAAYKANLKKLISYIKGNRKTLTAELELSMKQAAKAQRFEEAARLRNKLRHMQELQRRVMFGDREFLDISKDKALVDLKRLFGLADVPQRIEGFDISHHGGSDVVASMVVFTNGVSDRAEYRKFKMSSQRNDDTGNMQETLLRRFRPSNVKRWGLPSLVLVDGGKGQLNAAIQVLNQYKLMIPVVGIAKREEEIIIAKSGSHISIEAVRALSSKYEKSIRLLEDSNHLIINLHPMQRNASSHSRNLRGTDSVAAFNDIVKLFQRIRDESHRFAISYHTTVKRKRAISSQLEDIPGVGPITRKKLLRIFGSYKEIKRASEAELSAVVGKTKATDIRRHIHLP